MADRELYQGEAKDFPFRIKDRVTGRWLDLTGATFLLVVKKSPEDAEAVFRKVDADFTKSGAATGYVTVFLTAYDTMQDPWVYKAELRVTKAGSPIPIEKIQFDLRINRAITPNDWQVEIAGITSSEAFGTPIIANT